jgi:RNA 2',3'-cyclic 3'-phosphodiesterase
MRLFIAIDLPEPIKDALTGLRDPELSGVSWTRPSQLELIKSALLGVKGELFTLRLHGAGKFPTGWGAARVLWVGIEPQPALQHLYRKIEGALIPVGFPPEGQTFNPHITLGRIKRPGPNTGIDAFLKRHADFDAGVVEVREFILFSSVLGTGGSTYTREGVFGLGSESTE